MSTITLNLPDDALAKARHLAAEKRVPIEAVFAEAIEWIAESERQAAEFDAMAERGRHVDIDALLAKVPNVPPVPGDELD